MLDKNKQKLKRKNRKTFVGLYPRRTKTREEMRRQIEKEETKKQIKEYV